VRMDWSMSLPDVRRLAGEAGLVEMSFNGQSRVVSFGPRVADYGEQSMKRINVYWTTGTVGTCIEHPRQGKTQLFRRNVNLATLREIFRDPRIHTGQGYQRKRSAPPVQGARPSSAAHQPADEETEARQHLAWLDGEAQRIEAERAEVRAIVDGFERRRAEEAARRAEEEWARQAQAAANAAAAAREAEAARLEAVRTARGTGLIVRLDAFEDFVQDSFDRRCDCISTNGDATILLFDDGGWAWTGGLNKGLHKALQGRQKTLPRPTCVSISRDRWFVQFADGAWKGNVPDELEDSLLKEVRQGRRVASVAFGEGYDTYFVVYTDGYWGYNGSIPEGLAKVLNSRNSKADLTAVSLGPNGEWYISVRNGRAWWGGHTDGMSSSVAEVGNNVTFMDFGEDYTWLLRYK